MTEPIVRLEAVTKTYLQGNQTVAAVAGLSLGIEPGEFTALCGPSGSGKTTTLNLIGALDVPTSGSIRVEGRDISHLSREQLAAVRRDRIGFVFQAYNLIPVLTAYENAEFVLALKKVPVEERRRRVLEMLDAVGLGGLEDRRPDELSGGQQQRVGIARALAGSPRILLADEPTGQLDSNTAAAMIELIGSIAHDDGLAVLLSTHDPSIVERADRVLELHDGVLRATTPAR